MLVPLFLFLGGIGVHEVFMLVICGTWIWALIDCLKSDFSDSSTKLIWILVIIFVPIIGSILYLVIGRGQKSRA